MGKSSSTPPAPDYTGAANATAAGNRVSQVTPYGSFKYSETGTDTQGNPMWTATTTLSPEQQKLLDIQNQTSIGLGNLQQQGLGYVQNMLNKPFDTSTLPSLQGNLNQTDLSQVGQGPQFQSLGEADAMQRNLENQGMQGWDRATNLVMQRLQPQLDRQSKQLDTQLAQQGIMPGSEAYNVAKQQLAQGQNDLLNQAQLTGLGAQQQFFGQGLQAGNFYNTAAQQDYANQQAMLNQQNAIAQQGYGNQLSAQQANNAALQQMYANQLANAQLGNQARGQGFNELSYVRNEPINTLNAVRSGSQVTNPSFGQTAAGPDILGATQASYNAQLASANAQNAAQNSFTSGLMGLGGTLGGAALLKYSDIRTKENIKAIGWLPNGLPVYEYEYKPEWKNEAGHGKFIGVMAHEVEQIIPEAVVTKENGYKMVNYSLLG